MTTNKERSYEDISEQLQDSETWSQTSVADIKRVAGSYAFGELQMQMHLFHTGAPTFNPMIALSALTALHLDSLAHRDQLRFQGGG